MTRPIRLLATTVASLALVLAPTTAVVADEQVRCGQEVSGDVVLTANLRCRDGAGLRVVGDATIDLDGRALVGPGSASGTAAIAVGVGVTVTITDGTVRGWGAAVSGPPPWDGEWATVTVSRMTLADNGTAVAASAMNVAVLDSRLVRNGTGVHVWPGTAVVERSDVVRNGTGASVGDGSSLRIRRSSFDRNDVAVDCDQALTDVTDSSLRRNGTGLTSWWCTGTIARNDVVANGRGASLGLHDRFTVEQNAFLRNEVGVELRFGDVSLIRDNEFRGNGAGIRESAESEGAATVIQGNTLTRNGDGIYLTNPGVSLGGNAALRNTRWGIHAPGAIDLGGNTASRNGNPEQCLGVTC